MITRQNIHTPVIHHRGNIRELIQKINIPDDMIGSEIVSRFKYSKRWSWTYSIFSISPWHSHSMLTTWITYLGFPRNAAWCSELKPLLLVIVRSAWCSRSREIMSSRFLLMASWSGVSPSESLIHVTEILQVYTNARRLICVDNLHLHS